MEEEKFLSLGDIFLDDEKHMVYVKDEPCSLTFKEYELLKLLLHNAGIVVTREIILERVWGIDFEGESRTLDMHIRTLRQKLGEAGSMIRTVHNVEIHDGVQVMRHEKKNPHGASDHRRRWPLC